MLVVAGMIVSHLLARLKVESWALYIICGGSLSWIGLLKAHLHPALALAFIVPFMPLKISYPDRDAENNAEAGCDDVEMHHKSPLHDFEHQLKTFADIVVLFMFGLANAGVPFGGTGAYSVVIVLALIFGKWLGKGSFGWIANKYGFPYPNNLPTSDIFMAALISSLGMTVGLFIAGEAYPEEPDLEAQGKLGALFSVVMAFVCVGIGSAVDFKKQPVSEFAVKRFRSSVVPGLQRSSWPFWPL